MYCLSALGSVSYRHRGWEIFQSDLHVQVLQQVSNDAVEVKPKFETEIAYCRGTGSFERQSAQLVNKKLYVAFVNVFFEVLYKTTVINKLPNVLISLWNPFGALKSWHIHVVGTYTYAPFKALNQKHTKWIRKLAAGMRGMESSKPSSRNLCL